MTPPPRIATLTLNPTIDGASDAPVVQHTHKVRTTNERFDPGGGGINVARVLARFASDGGAHVEAVYLCGGVTGPVLTGLLDRAGLRQRPLPIAGDTRISLAVHETETGKEYRFVPQGPELSEAEWQGTLAALDHLDCDWLVMSGSLPRGVPVDFYARAARTAKERGVRVVLDTSGPALATALAEPGAIHLVKPSLGEMEQFAGRPLRDPAAVREAAQAVVAQGGAAMVAVTMGHEGALLAHADGVEILPAIEVEVRSAVGAGDSFAAAMTHGLAHGLTPAQAFALGIAAGTAAVMTPGTDLCHRADVEALAARLGVQVP